MKVIAHKLRQHIAMIFAAAVCALVIFYIIQNPNLFQASILSLEEKAFMNQKNRDVAYKTNQGPFEIFIAEKYILHMTDFEGTIYFDPDKVQLDADSSTGQGIFQITQTSKDSLSIEMTMPDKIDADTELIGIPFSGDAQHIILGESKGKIKRKRTSFAVGNLNEFEQHSQ